MKRVKSLGAILAVLGLLLTGCATLMSSDKDISFVTPEQLNQMLGNPNLVVVDVRDPVSWSNSPSKISGAVRLDPTHVDASAIAGYPKDKRYVFYCA